MLSLKYLPGLLCVGLLSLPAMAAEPNTKATQLSNVKTGAQPIVIEQDNRSQELEAEQRRYQAPKAPFGLRRVASPAQKMPRGNNEAALQGDQSDVIVGDVVTW
ncbi:MAG: hypothetical protein H7Y22_17545 [Gemmatimonadaceae bacterium]|nr:hypothetical protein [Gloeobacterales cyanobacterium ES-bin-141]